jgi:hypothetical protein
VIDDETAPVLCALALGARVEAAEKLQRLTGAQIQAKFAGMEMTDEVHWGDIYQRNGTLVTYSMGHKSVGTWSVRKDELCLNRGQESRAGCYEVWLAGKKVELRQQSSSLPLEGVLRSRPMGADPEQHGDAGGATRK